MRKHLARSGYSMKRDCSRQKILPLKVFRYSKQPKLLDTEEAHLRTEFALLRCTLAADRLGQLCRETNTDRTVRTFRLVGGLP